MADQASGEGGGAPDGSSPGDHLPAGALKHPSGGIGAPSQETDGDDHGDLSGGGTASSLQSHRPRGSSEEVSASPVK